VGPPVNYPQARGLFKMDTIGDAYVVAGFVAAPASAATRGGGPLSSRPASARSARGGGAAEAGVSAVCADVLQASDRHIHPIHT
jgi:hypothetical protein